MWLDDTRYFTTYGKLVAYCTKKRSQAINSVSGYAIDSMYVWQLQVYLYFISGKYIHINRNVPTIRGSAWQGHLIRYRDDLRKEIRKWVEEWD